MKNQASVLLQVVDSPINTTIPAGYLSIRAKSTGLVVIDSSGTETAIGSGGGGSEFTGVTLATTSGLTGNGTSGNGLGLNFAAMYASGNLNIGYNASGSRLSFTAGGVTLYSGSNAVFTCTGTPITLGTSSNITTVPGGLTVSGKFIIGTTEVAAANIVANPVKGYAAGYTLRILTQAAYDALSTKDNNTVYYIVG